MRLSVSSVAATSNRKAACLAMYPLSRGNSQYRVTPSGADILISAPRSLTSDRKSRSNSSKEPRSAEALWYSRSPSEVIVTPDDVR